MKRFLLVPFVILLIVLLQIRCTPNIAGNATQTGNAVGILYNPDGSRAANAKVYIYSVDHNPKPIERVMAIDSTTTDDTGAFVVDSVPEGYYNVLGDGDSGISYADSVFIDNDSIPTEVIDTLGDAGTLRGVIALQPGDDSRTVFILVFGTQTWTTPADSIGNFTLSSMAEGTYHVRLLTTLDDYDVIDTNLSIIAGTVDTLSDTIYLPFTGIPIPQGLSLAYDTMKQIVTLTWDACDTTLVQGYNVYRKHSDSDFVRINISIIEDTTYSDSSAIQDETYEYKIKAVDKSDEEGKFSEEVSVIVVPSFNFIDSISLKIDASAPFRFVIGKDGSIFIAYRTDAFIGVFSSTGDSLNSFGGGMFNQIYDVALDSRENVYTVDPDKDKVVKFSKDGDSLHEWALENPSAMTIDPEDNIYTIFADEHGLSKYDTSGIMLDSIMFPQVNKITCLIIANNGSILLGDAEEVNVKEYTKDLVLINTFEVFAKNNKQYRIASSDDKGNKYFIVEFIENSIVKYELYIYNSSNEYIAKLRPNLNVYDIEIVNNNLFVLDPYNIIKVFSINF